MTPQGRSNLAKFLLFAFIIVGFLATVGLMFVHPFAALLTFFGTLLVVGITVAVAKLSAGGRGDGTGPAGEQSTAG